MEWKPVAGRENMLFSNACQSELKLQPRQQVRQSELRIWWEVLALAVLVGHYNLVCLRLVKPWGVLTVLVEKMCMFFFRGSFHLCHGLPSVILDIKQHSQRLNRWVQMMWWNHTIKKNVNFQPNCLRSTPATSKENVWIWWNLWQRVVMDFNLGGSCTKSLNLQLAKGLLQLHRLLQAIQHSPKRQVSAWERLSLRAVGLPVWRAQWNQLSQCIEKCYNHQVIGCKTSWTYSSHCWRYNNACTVERSGIELWESAFYQHNSLAINTTVCRVEECERSVEADEVRAVVELEDRLCPEQPQNNVWSVSDGNPYIRTVGAHFVDPPPVWSVNFKYRTTLVQKVSTAEEDHGWIVAEVSGNYLELDMHSAIFVKLMLKEKPAWSALFSLNGMKTWNVLVVC